MSEKKQWDLIVNKWKGKAAYVKSFYSLSKEQNNIDIILISTHKCLKLMVNLDIKKNMIIKRVTILREEYSRDIYDMFPICSKKMET